MAMPNPAPTQWGSIILTARAQAHFCEFFLPRYQKILQEIDHTPLAVLIWGPGPTGGILYDKRLRIRDALRGNDVTAVFSEEIPQPTDYSLSAHEFAQAQVADLIIVIECSNGSTAEVHDFARIRSVASKLLVFIDANALEGYSYKGLLCQMNERFNNVHPYKYPEDIVQCNLLENVVSQVRFLRETRWFRDRE
jgi:hypothetical protein